MLIYLGDTFWVDPRRVVAIRALPPKLYEGHCTAVLIAPQNREVLLYTHYKDVMRNYFMGQPVRAVWEDVEPKNPEAILDIFKELEDMGFDEEDET